MATPDPTHPRQHIPPKPGARPGVRTDAALSDDFAVLMTPGVTASDAIRLAVRQLANMYRTAWTNGVCPTGTPPALAEYRLAPRADAHPPRPVPPAPDRRQPPRRRAV